MRKLNLILTALFLISFTGVMTGQTAKTAQGKLPVPKADKTSVAKANPNSMTTAIMDPGFVPSDIKPVNTFSNAAKAITAYGFNAYGGTVAVGPVTVDIPAGTLTSIAANANWTAGADWADGVWYGVQYVSGANAPLVTLDPSTGAITTIGGGAADLTGIAYDINTGIMYAIDFTGGLYTIDLTTGATTTVGSAAMASCIGLACDNMGLLYAIDLDDNLYTINSATAAKTLVGPLGIDIGYAQDIAYDRDNEKLYGTLYNVTSGSGGLYEINITTGAATLLADFVSEVTGFAIPYTPVNDDAPAAVTAYTVTPGATGALNALAAWTNPTLTYSGNTLTSLTTATLLVNNNPTPVYQNATPVVGGNESYTYNITTPGFYKFTAYASNAVGDGELTHITVWIGEDVPAAPGNVVLTNPSGMDASLSWTAPTVGLNGAYFSGANVTYDVIRMPGNVLVSDNQAGLTFNETIVNPGNYYYKVIASNNSGVGGNANSNVVLFGDFLIYEDFEGLFPNTGWSAPTGTGVWAQNAGTVHPAGVPAHSPTQLAYFNSWTCQAGSTASLITPTVDMAGITGDFSYWMYHEPGYSGANDRIQLKISTDNGSTWTDVGTPVSRYSATAGWVKHSYIITGGTATTSFDFFATSEYGNDIHIDDVQLYEITGCIQPSFLTANPADVSAILDWTENSTATAWEIEWGATGFTQGAGTIVPVTAKPYTLSGLTAYTTYDYYVRANCGGSYSIWVGPFTFTTIGCPPANQCTYSYTMSDSWGDGWNGASITVAENGHNIKVITLASGSAGNGTIALCAGATITLSWTEGAYDEECGFNLLDPSSVSVLSFAAGASPAAGQFFSFSACPTCPAPSALTATGITLYTANLGWTSNGSETLWNLQWGPNGFTPGSGTMVNGLTATSYALSGLNMSTAYSFYVQADCGGGDLSSWSGPYNFNTACPTNITYPWFDDFENGIGCYTITGINTAETWYYDAAAFDPLSGVANVTIEYDPALNPANEWFISPTFNFVGLTDPTITFNWNMSYNWGVSPNNNYDVYLKGSTDGINWVDLWTEPAVFTDWTWYDTTISLAAFSGEPIFYFAFNYVGIDGAAFYLDDVTIDGIVSSKPFTVKPLLVYPNPSTGMVYMNQTAEKVEVTDMLGQVLVNGNNTDRIDLSSYNKGVYIIRITQDNQTTLHKITLVK